MIRISSQVATTVRFRWSLFLKRSPRLRETGRNMLHHRNIIISSSLSYLIHLTVSQRSEIALIWIYVASGYVSHRFRPQIGSLEGPSNTENTSE